MRMANAVSPTMIGMIAAVAVERRVADLAQPRAGRSRSCGAASSTSSGSRRSTRTASSAERGDGRRQGVREQLRPRALRQQVADLLAGGDEPAGRAAERLAERARDHVDLAEHAEVLGHATPGLAHDARPVRVVDDARRPRARARARRSRASRARSPSIEKTPSVMTSLRCPALARGKPLAELVHRRVLVDHLARRSREPDGVDDRGMVELVREDDGVLVGERRDRRLVRVPARDVGQRRLGADEVG